MHILILTLGFPTFSGNITKGSYGGSFLLHEAHSYVKAGAKVTVLTIHVPGLPIKEKINDNFTIIRVPYFLPIEFQKIRIPNYPLYTKKLIFVRLFQLPFFILSYLVYMLKYSRDCDIIHANWTPTALLSLPFRFLFRRPVFLTFRGSDITLLPKFLNKFIIKHVDGVFNWKLLGDINKYINLFKGNYIDLPMITDLKLMHKHSDFRFKNKKDPIVFTFVGRLIETEGQKLKGLTIIIPAILKLINVYKKSDRFVVNFLGDGPALEKLQNQACQLNLEHYVHFWGNQNDIFPFLKKTNVVLGGIGLNAVVQEAAFSNCLLMMIGGQDWAGDVWKNHVNAVFYKPNDVDSIAAAMNFVIENPSKCQEISHAGKRTIKKYATDVDTGGVIYLDFFKKLIDRK